MKAVALTKYLPVSDPDCLFDIELKRPDAKGRDLLVHIDAVSVNPVDTKIRSPKSLIEDNPKILGWDACGVVESVGENVTLFAKGDKVFYAGDVTKQGSNSEYQLVDERLVGFAPSSLDGTQIAAMPLTAITAWEAIFERLVISQNKSDNHKKSLLIIGGAGGVGSIAIQLASVVAGLTVIATASRPESIAWCKNMGANYVINHYESLSEQLRDLKLPHCDYILCCNSTDQYFDPMIELIKPKGKICCIVDNTSPLEMQKLKPKSATFCWEFMFTRAMFKTDDMIEQHHILNRVAQLLDEGVLKSTLNQVYSPINAENLRLAHRDVEQGAMIGKVVLSLWK